MTQYQLLQAIPALQLLVNYKLPVKTAYSLYKLAKKAEEYKEFLINEERKLVNEYHGTVDENGRIQFNNVDDMQNFTTKHNELVALEAEDAETLVIQADDLGDQKLSASDIALLEGIIDIE